MPVQEEAVSRVQTLLVGRYCRLAPAVPQGRRDRLLAVAGQRWPCRLVPVDGAVRGGHLRLNRCWPHPSGFPSAWDIQQYDRFL